MCRFASSTRALDTDFRGRDAGAAVGVIDARMPRVGRRWRWHRPRRAL